MKKIALLIVTASLMSACGQTGPGPKPPAPGVKVGTPYQVFGKTYYPEYDPDYDKTGIASWYGPGFHGNKTANGERFDQDDMTAAHPTLPMPSLVRVTNLSNGESAVVRVNDRGPFKENRLIDLSRASAKALGITGLQKVRVQYLKDETESYWAQMNLQTDDIRFARNDQFAPKAGEVGGGGYDGMVVARDETPSQVKDSAPVTSVSSVDLVPPGGNGPRPSYGLVSEANASELQPAAQNGQSQPVQLLDTSGKPVGSPAAEDARVIRHAAADAPRSPFNPPPREIQMASLETPAQPKAASDVSGGPWFIQAGSFSSQENAERLAQRMKKLAEVDVRPIDVNGQTWHRVRIGPFTDRAEADAALTKAVEQGASGARMVQN